MYFSAIDVVFCKKTKTNNICTFRLKPVNVISSFVLPIVVLTDKLHVTIWFYQDCKFGLK